MATLTTSQLAICALIFGAGVATVPVIEKVHSKVAAKGVKKPPQHVHKIKRVRTPKPSRDLSEGLKTPSPIVANDCITLGGSYVSYYSSIWDVRIVPVSSYFNRPSPPVPFVDSYTRDTFWDVPSVPEPVTWVYMIAGFGMIGLSLRKKENYYENDSQ